MFIKKKKKIAFNFDMKACFCEFLSKKKTNYVDHGIIYKMNSRGREINVETDFWNMEF